MTESSDAGSQTAAHVLHAEAPKLRTSEIAANYGNEVDVATTLPVGTEGD